jgi:fructokinase
MNRGAHMTTPIAFGGVEAGGTKFSCLVGTGPDDIRARITIPTTSPRETLEQVSAFFLEQRTRYRLAAVGVASFGPVDLVRGSRTYGHILATPKPFWHHVDLIGPIAAATGDPDPAFDTDVNAAALAEYTWGATPDVDPLLYLTVGTGIGGGAIVHGRVLHGRVHPEMGHIRVPLVPGDSRPGCCPVHGACLEGLASGRAISERYGTDPRWLPDDHPAWTLTTEYLALGIANLILTLAPKRVVVGGGVSRRIVWPRLHERLDVLLGGYPAPTESWTDYVMPPRLGDDAGPLGAIALARASHESRHAGLAPPGVAVPDPALRQRAGERRGAR